MKNLYTHKGLIAAAGFMLFVTIAGCAQYAPVPGGTDTNNASFYKTKEDFLSRLPGLIPGMSKAEVLDRLGRKEGDLVRLSRDETMTALLGTNNITFKDGASDQNLIQSLYGYRLRYKSVARKHGFTSPIRIRTDEKGFDYSVTLIFSNGLLYERPVITGGIVNDSSSKTFFDFINPGLVIDRTGR